MPPSSFDRTDVTRSDSSLVTLVRNGDENAARELYDRYVHRLQGLVKAKMGSKLRAFVDPEDIVQSVFKSIFRGVKSGLYDAPPGETLWNLLAVVAVNKVSRNGNQQSAMCRDVDRTLGLDESNEPSQPESFAAEQLELEIREILETFRPSDREILELRLQLFGIDEISAKTGHAMRTVERSLQKSRQRLASLLLDDDQPRRI